MHLLSAPCLSVRRHTIRKLLPIFLSNPTLERCAVYMDSKFVSILTTTMDTLHDHLRARRCASQGLTSYVHIRARQSPTNYEDKPKPNPCITFSSIFSASVLVIEKNKINNDHMLMLRACTPHYLQICYISDWGAVSYISVCVSAWRRSYCY